MSRGWPCVGWHSCQCSAVGWPAQQSFDGRKTAVAKGPGTLRDFHDGFCGADGSDVRKRKSNLHGTPSGDDAGYLTMNPLATQTGDRGPGLLAAWKQRGMEATESGGSEARYGSVRRGVAAILLRTNPATDDPDVLGLPYPPPEIDVATDPLGILCEGNENFLQS